MVHQSASQLQILVGIILGLTSKVELYQRQFAADLDRINTTAVYNVESKTYDIPPGTPFNVTCDYSNVQTNLYELLISWEVYYANRKTEIFGGGGYIRKQPNFTAIPADIPRYSAGNGSITLVVLHAPLEYYSRDDLSTLKYRCEVHALNGSSQDVADSIRYSACINISVIAPAQIPYITENTTVVEGEPVELRCNASGMPQPSIRWEKEMDGSAVHQTKSVDGVLMWEHVTAASSGTYVCLVTNRVTDGDLSRKTSIEVIYQPEVLARVPVVYQFLGGRGELGCLVYRSHPFPSNNKWYYKSPESSAKYGEEGYGTEISNNNSRYHYTSGSDHSGVMQSTLTIEPVQQKDYDRIFCCVFMNDVGNGENCISVTEITTTERITTQAGNEVGSIFTAHFICTLSACLVFSLYTS